MPSAMDEFFGEAEGRPNHPDFWKLAEILLGIDGYIHEQQEAGRDKLEDVEKYLREFVDPESLRYVAQQRIFRALGISNEFVALMREKEIVQHSSAWVDGFVVGVKFRESKVAK
jgi:hypothetical protein